MENLNLNTKNKNGKKDKYSRIVKDLEEAAKNFIINEFPPHVTSDNDADVESAYNRAIDTFIAGAEWHKKKMKETLQTEYEKGRFDMMDEMMKDAVDGIVHHFNGDKLAAMHYNDPKGTPMSIYVSSKGLSAGDKVKIIIIKTEQQ